MLLKFKPKDDTKLKFAPMGAKKPDVENAADAKKPSDTKEDAGKKKSKTKSKSSYFAKKAATVLAAEK